MINLFIILKLIMIIIIIIIQQYFLMIISEKKSIRVPMHVGVRTDELAGMGAKLRHDLMVKSQPRGWFRSTVERYVSNRV